MTDEQERYTARKVGEVSIEAMQAMSKALNEWIRSSKHNAPLLHFGLYVAIRALAEASPPPVQDQESQDLLSDIVRAMKRHVALGTIEKDSPEPLPGAKVGRA